MHHYSINGKSLFIWYLFNLVIIVVIILTHILTMKCWICVVKKASGKVADFFSSFSIFQVSSNKSADYIYNVENGSF